LKTIRTLLVAIMVGTLFGSAQTKDPNLVATGPENVIPDEKTAIAVAEAILIPIYGEQQVLKERPYRALLKEGIWIVRGTFHNLGGKISVDGGPSTRVPIAVGGVATVEISKSNGCIKRIVHTQ
jgi:hypothetical protein